MSSENKLREECRDFIRKWDEDEIIILPSVSEKILEINSHHSESRKIKWEKTKGNFKSLIAGSVSYFKLFDDAYPRLRPVANPDVIYDLGFNTRDAISTLIKLIDIGRAEGYFLPGPAYDKKLEDLNNQIAVQYQQLLNRSDELNNAQNDNVELRSAL